MKCVPDIEYDTGNGLALDLYVPDTLTSEACIVFAHSTAFLSGGKSNTELLQFADFLTRHGFSVAAMEFRHDVTLADFSEEEGDAIHAAIKRSARVGVKLDEALYSEGYHAAIEDVSRAIGFLSREAQDMAVASPRIGFLGIGAGGIAGLGTAFPPDHMESRISAPSAIVTISSALVQPWRMKEDCPPTLLINTGADSVIPIEVARIGLARAVAWRAHFDLIEAESDGQEDLVDVVLEWADTRGIAFTDRILAHFEVLKGG